MQLEPMETICSVVALCAFGVVLAWPCGAPVLAAVAVVGGLTVIFGVWG